MYWRARKMKSFKNKRGLTSTGAIVIIIAACVIAAPIAWYFLGIPPMIVEKPVIEPVTISVLAEMIRNGTIDVGTDYSMAPTARYHVIHSDILGLSEEACHIDDEYSEDFLYQRKYKEPDLRDSPGVVDRAICMSCHRAGGTANELYGIQW
jgi:hypothetical protein